MGFFSDVWDTVSSAVSTAVEVVVDAVTTVTSAVVEAVETVVGVVTNVVAAAVDFIFSIPILGAGLKHIWNAILTAGWFVTGILTDGLFFIVGLGALPEKRLRLKIVIQLDEMGAPVTTAATIATELQAAINYFKTNANVRVIPDGPFEFFSAFSKNPAAADAGFVVTETTMSDPATLDVSCNGSGLLEDLGVTGGMFQRKIIANDFWGGTRRILGIGSPIVAFAVRSFKTPSIGCSMGPTTDYVTVMFGAGSSFTLTHEMGHASNLPHVSDPMNLMTSAFITGNPPTLDGWQVALLRASRHVSYH